MADTTTRYTLPFQETTDAPDGPALGEDLAEAIETALGDVEDAHDARLDAAEASITAAQADIAALEAAITPVITTVTATVGTVATGFTVNDVRAATMAGGKLVSIDLYIQRSGADITATAGNIADTTIFTLAVAYRPSHDTSLTWSSGSVSGEAAISTAGVVNLRTASGNITTSQNIRMSATYILN